LTAGSRPGSVALLAIPAGVLAGLLAIIGAETEPLYALVGLGAIAVGFLALLRPVYSIYLAILLLPFEAAATAQTGSFGITPTEVVVVASAIGWLVGQLARGGELPQSPLIPALLAVLAVHIPGLFLAANKFAVFKEMFMWGAMFVCFLAILADRDERTSERLAGAIAIAGAAVAGVAIAKSAGTAQVASEYGGIVTNRAVGPFASPVLLGTFIMICVPAQVVFMLRGRTQMMRLAGMGAAALSLAALALSLSRSAFVALTAALLFVVVFWRPARKPAVIAIGLLTVVLLTGLNPAPSVFNPDVIKERITSIGSPDTHTAELRFRIWRKAPEIVEDNFPFGIGPKNLPERAGEYDLLFFVGAPSNAHNTFLVVVTEFGLPGFIVLVWLVISLTGILARGVRFAEGFDRALAIAMAATFLALIVDGITGYSYGANAFAVIVFMLAAIACRIERSVVAKARQPAPQPPPALIERESLQPA
jgi:O-antigen ligase